MNRIAFILLIAGIGIGVIVGYAMHRSPPVAQSESVAARPAQHSVVQHEAAQHSQPGEGRVLYWYDPMRPDQHFDKPGKSPYMDMQLLPKYAGEGAVAAQVAVDAMTVQNLGIRTARVERGALRQTLQAVGSVGYDENDVAVVQARAAGYIARLYVRAPLAHVIRGAALADLVAPDWVAAEEEYVALRRSTSADAALRDAARARLAVLGIPEQEIRSLERGGNAQARTTLTAPIDGVVAELGARDGMAVMPGTPLFRINGMGRVWVTADVPEAQAALAHNGATAAISVPAWPGRTFDGKVVAVLPSVAQATRTQQVRIETGNPDGALSPGMYASLLFEQTAGASRLIVPSEAVIRTGTRSVVIAASDSGFRPVDVRVGAESNGRTEILDGLSEGDRIVLSGQFLIDSEASLRATMTRLGAGESEAKP
jgi:Cu(I)/Ag(I) efflux system membrane fusion protein